MSDNANRKFEDAALRDILEYARDASNLLTNAPDNDDVQAARRCLSKVIGLASMVRIDYLEDGSGVDDVVPF